MLKGCFLGHRSRAFDGSHVHQAKELEYVCPIPPLLLQQRVYNQRELIQESPELGETKSIHIMPSSPYWS